MAILCVLLGIEQRFDGIDLFACDEREIRLNIDIES